MTTSQPSSPTGRKWFGIASVVLTIAIAIGWMCATPIHTDDFFYQRMPGPDEETAMWTCSGEFITSFSQVPEAIVNHRHTINGRFSNFAYLAVQPLPMWLIKLLCGVFLASFGLVLWRWCGRRSWLNPTYAIGVPLLLWTGLQWNDQMQSSDFQFNYTVTSLMMVGCMMFFFRSDRRPGPWAWVLLAIFAVWHECFTIAFGCLLGVKWLFRPNRYTFIACLVLVAGALVQFSPGTEARMYDNALVSTLTYYPWTLLLSKGWVSIVALVWWPLRRRKVEAETRRLFDCFGFGLLLAWVATILLIALVAAPQRAHWPNDVIAICFILSILGTYKPVKLPNVLAVILTVAYGLWGVSLVCWQLRYTRFTNYCLNELAKGRFELVDGDGLLETHAPFWLMGMTSPMYGTFSAWPYFNMAYCGSSRQTRGFVVLPWRDFDKPFESWPKVEGDNDFRYATRTQLIRRRDGRELIGKKVRVTFGGPTLSTTPLDYAIGAMRGVAGGGAKELTIGWVHPFVLNGDSLEAISINEPPRTYAGRDIITVDLLP